MIHSESSIRLDRGCQESGSDDRLGTHLLIGVVQFFLAIVFVPVVVTIFLLVGLYMVVEWGHLRVGVATPWRHGDFGAIPPFRASLSGVTTIR